MTQHRILPTLSRKAIALDPDIASVDAPEMWKYRLQARRNWLLLQGCRWALPAEVDNPHV